MCRDSRAVSRAWDETLGFVEAALAGQKYPSIFPRPLSRTAPEDKSAISLGDHRLK